MRGKSEIRDTLEIIDTLAIHRGILEIRDKNEVYQNYIKSILEIRDMSTVHQKCIRNKRYIKYMLQVYYK